MRLYRSRVDSISKKVIQDLTDGNHIEVDSNNRMEAIADLEAIMLEHLNRDRRLRDSVRERMANRRIPYDEYPKIRSQLAKEWGHPLGSQLEKYLSIQFVESFMVSPYIEEVYSDDFTMRRIIMEVLKEFDVDEAALRDEARAQLKNISETSAEYEIRFAQALREVRVRHGLLEERKTTRK
ncbi:MAG: DUF507 family protein [Myxococcota bacterium]|nr:DUF507 family protein [Myxococcota bacterium]